MTTSTLRPNLPSHSPTSSASSQTTTPTSPRFAHHNQVAHPYASSSYSLDRAAVSSTSLASTPMTIHHPRPPTPPLFRPPPNLALPQYLKTWGEGEIQHFLSIYKCGHYIDAFKQNDIDGNVLLDLDMAMLKELGVAKVGERVKLLSGIKDLRRRVSVARSMPKVELRLNGAPTPPLDDGAFMGGGRLRQQQESSSLGNRRLHSNRPAPLDLQPHASRNLPQAYQGNPPSATHSQTSRSTTPRPIPPVDGLVRRPSDYTSSSGVYGSSSRPSLASYASSSSTVMPDSGGSVPPPASRAGTQSNNFNLRAPPSRDPGRRSPSPVNDASNFIDRPLPPAPSHAQGQGQSSAAEYANAITQQRQNSASTPTWAQSDHQYGLPRAPAPGSADRRTAAQAVAARAIDPVHRKTPSMEAMSASANKKSTSPIKSKFQGILGRPQPAQHPFAAPRTVEERKPSPPQGTSGASNSAPGQTHRRQLTASSALPGATSSAPSSTVTELRARRPGAEASSSGVPALEELIKQVVKFTNVEDSTTRTVNVQTCNSGVDVLERVLKKFGKWRATNIHTDTESDDDGNFEVDGWGVYTEQDDDDAKPLSEHALLQVCRLHRDGTTLRGKGLYLKRTRKLQNRKNMESLLGEAPPLSPTSPTGYYTHNPVGRSSLLPTEDPNLLTPSKAAGSKKMNRASTVSIMSGLGVPLSEIPPSPTARSPSSGGILTKKKMYNFFGHRPPSELISNHLAEYFPNATKKTLEKTARHSSIRMSLGPNNPLLNTRNSFMSIDGGRRSLDVPPPLPGKRGSIMSTKDAIARDSPPRRSRPGSRGITSPPAASTIVEESETLLEPVPRVSVSNDDGRTSRPTIDGEPATRDSNDDAASISSVQSQPPLLPPFEPSSESLSDSLQAYSPTPQTAKPRPRSIALQRRESAGSTRSRMSMLSQLRRQQDRSDAASLLTVDEITAEVEQRRASTITFEESDEDEDEEKVLAPPTGNVASGEIGVGVPESEDEGDDEAEEEEEEEEFSDEDESEEESDGAEDADHGRAFTSEGSKRSIKWIKGALIGAGSFGSVYLGMDAHTGLLMAVKQVELPTGVLRNEERKQSMVTALEREIELLKDLQHENIVQYLDSSADGDCLNIFLEYVPGGSVAALLSNYGAFEEALVRNFCRQILTGLNYLHQREIIHRDIKGANILVDNKGGIKISDFGISKKVENNLMNSMRGGNRPSLQGSVFWMAPEIVKQTSHTTKADIWSVGCLVVEMLTGTHPWADLSQMQAIFKIGSQARPATPSDISPDAADFLHKTFEIDYKMRPTAQQLLEHPFLAQRPTQLISAQQAKASMAAAQKAMQGGMQSMGQVLGKA